MLEPLEEVVGAISHRDVDLLRLLGIEYGMAGGAFDGVPMGSGFDMATGIVWVAKDYALTGLADTGSGSGPAQYWS